MVTGLRTRTTCAKCSRHMSIKQAGAYFCRHTLRKSNNGGPHEKRTTTMSPGHAGVLQTKDNMPTQKPRPELVLPEPPLLFKVRVLKASTKNPGLTPLTPPQARAQ